MKNIEMKQEGNVLVIRVDLTKTFGPSASGKTIIIASTEGNAPVASPTGERIAVGINVYKPRSL